MGKTKLICTVVVTAMIVFAGAPASASGPAAGFDVFSTSALNRLCADAQQTVLSKDVEVRNAVSTTWPGFVDSDAAPYSVVGGTVPLTYTPPEAPDLPLLSTQHVFYSVRGRREIPTVVSCKMKSAAYLNTVDPSLGAVDQSCKAVAETIVDAAWASLSRSQRRRVRHAPVIEDDSPAATGADWTASFPEEPFPVLYRPYVGSPLYVRARALFVSPHPDDIPAPPPFFNFIAFCNATGGDQGFLGSACEPRKWGVRYCHLPSPAYVRAALLRQLRVPTCGTPSADPRVCP